MLKLKLVVLVLLIIFTSCNKDSSFNQDENLNLSPEERKLKSVKDSLRNEKESLKDDLQKLRDSLNRIDEIDPAEMIPDSQEISQVPNDPEHFTWIIFLSEGPTEWFMTDDSEYGIAYRVSIDQVEIYRGLYVEKVSFQPEGFGKKLAYVKEVDIVNKLNLFGEATSTLEFIEWIDYKTFVFKVAGNKYKAEINRDENVIIKPM